MARQDLLNALAALGLSVATANTGCNNAFDRQDTKLLLVNAAVGPVTAAGVVIANRGSDFYIPVTFVPKPSGPVASLQFDLLLPANMTYVSTQAGPAATAAGKSVQASLNGSLLRVIVFGLNATNIGQGVLLTIRLRGESSMNLGIYSLAMEGVVGSTAAGVQTILSGVSGTVTLR